MLNVFSNFHSQFYTYEVIKNKPPENKGNITLNEEKGLKDFPSILFLRLASIQITGVWENNLKDIVIPIFSTCVRNAKVANEFFWTHEHTIGSYLTKMYNILK